MPKFVIERQYLVPMYQHIAVEAESLEEACKKGPRSPDAVVRDPSGPGRQTKLADHSAGCLGRCHGVRRAPAFMDRTQDFQSQAVRRGLPAGGRWIRTCMGLFLSSRRFWLLSVLCSERESRSSSRRLRSGSRSARKGSRDRNGSKAWRLAA